MPNSDREAGANMSLFGVDEEVPFAAAHVVALDQEALPIRDIDALMRELDEWREESRHSTIIVGSGPSPERLLD